MCDASAAAADAGDADDVAMATTRCDDEIDASDLPVHLQLGAHLPSLGCDDDDEMMMMMMIYLFTCSSAPS